MDIALEWDMAETICVTNYLAPCDHADHSSDTVFACEFIYLFGDYN